MSSKRRLFYSPQPQQDEKPWLRYPDPEKPTYVHSRTYTPVPATKSLELSTQPRSHGHASRSETQPVGLRHKRSSSKLHSGNSSNASLPMSLTSSNSSSDSIANPQPLRLSSSSKPKSLSEELSALQSNGSDTGISNNKAMAYPSPITPSDLLGIPDPSTFSSTPLTPSDSPVQKADDGRKPRLSLLSINTTLGSRGLEDSSFTFSQGSPTSMRDSATNSEGPGSPRVNVTVPGDHTPPLPRLSHSSSHSSSASNSSFSNPSSPNSITPHSHQHHHHHSCPHHKQDRHHRHHHPSCHHHAPGHRHGVRSDRATKGLGRHGIPQLEEHEGELSSLSPPEEGQLDNPEKEMSMGLGIEVTPSSTTTAVTIVGSTPAFGIHAFREQEDQENNALGLYSAEPPKKRQRSAAAVLLGAAVETVIFTSAVALSAYQLLTGKGKQQLEDATMTPTPDETTAAERTALEQSEMSIVPIKSAPVNIPTRAGRHRDSGLLGKSLHHNHHVRPHHKSKHSSKSRHGLSASLPHAYEYDHMKEAMTLPGRPNTGTEDNDEQFLRMEAQLTSLIAEGKRALSSRIADWAEA